MLLAAPDFLKPTLPVSVSTAIAVGTAVVCFLLALLIVRFGKALGGLVGAGAGLVGASSLLPWASGDAGGLHADFDAWKRGQPYALTKLWTNVGPNDLRWGIPLVAAAALMFLPVEGSMQSPEHRDREDIDLAVVHGDGRDASVAYVAHGRIGVHETAHSG